MLAVGVIAVGTVLLAWASSQFSPAWAMRYLAIAVPPFLLLVAAGLANARGIGILGLIIVVFLWGYDVWPTTKSNVRPVAHAIGPSLAPGDVVVSTQPEQVPVLHHYLPPGLRYATLTGYVKDVGVTDWRDGVDRLRASSPEHDLKPIMDALRPGQRLVHGDADHLRAWTAGTRRGPSSCGCAPRSSSSTRATTRASRPTTVYPPFPRKEGPNPVEATVLLKTAS